MVDRLNEECKPRSRKLAHVIYNDSRVHRHYFQEENELEMLLETFGREMVSLPEDDASIEGPKQRALSRFKYVGKVNVTLQMCSRCRDAGKPFMKDIYYIDKEEMAKSRTILCVGCLGSYLVRIRDRYWR